MILAILDDLLFTSKIRAAASKTGTVVVFSRSSQAALTEMQKGMPALVILDLNSPAADPLGTVAAMKADPRLASVPIVGFVSHVHASLIDAARKAGVDDVMARSAFAERLPEILGQSSSRP
jgi:PleD family two-component response regulator